MQLSRPFIIMLLSALVLGIYYPALFAPLCLTDDYTLFLAITDKKFSWREIFVPGTVAYYRPLYDVSLWFEQILWMFEESFMHFDNMLMHLANVILVFFVALRSQLLVFDRQSQMAACGAAAVFAVHPLCSESILWIPARVDPMAAFFIYLGLLLLLTGLYNGRNIYTVFSFLSLFVGSLAKEPAVFLFPAFLFFSYCHWLKKSCSVVGADEGRIDVLGGFLQAIKLRIICVFRWGRCNWWIILMFSLLPVCYMVMRRIASTKVDRGTIATYMRITEKVAVTIWDPIFLALKGLGFYLKKFFIPWPLNFTIVEVSDWYILLGIIFIGIVFYLLWRGSLILSFFLLASTAVIPAVIVLLAGLGWTPYAERYLYISIAPAVIGFMLLIQEAERLRLYRTLITVSIVALFAITTVNRNILWTDSLAFYKDCVNKAPNFNPALRNYAAALAREGLNAEAREFRRNNVLVKQSGDLFFSKSTNSTAR